MTPRSPAQPTDGLPASCDTATSGAGHHCRFIASSYNFGGSIDDTMIPKTIGFCAPTSSNWGDCTTYSPREIAQALAEAQANGEDEGQALQAFCDDNPEKCAFGCVKPETLDAIFAEEGATSP